MAEMRRMNRAYVPTQHLGENATAKDYVNLLMDYAFFDEIVQHSIV